MTHVDDWHVSDHELERYANQTIPMFTRASVESHVLECERCRGTLARCAVERTDATTDVLWLRIADAIDVSGRPMRSSITAFQVSIASPLLLLATLTVAVGVVASVGLAAAISPRAALPLFVMLAPVAPVIGAVLAFQPGIDPAGQLAAATPLAAGRLPFFRAMFASGVALLAVAGASFFVPVEHTDVAIWLLPGLALTSLVVATSTWFEPRRVAFGLGSAWGLAVTMWAWGPGSRSVSLDLGEFAVERPSVQGALLVITVCSIVVTIIRRDELPAWRTG